MPLTAHLMLEQLLERLKLAPSRPLTQFAAVAEKIAFERVAAEKAKAEKVARKAFYRAA